MKTVKDIKLTITTKDTVCEYGIASVEEKTKYFVANKLFILFNDNSKVISLGCISQRGSEVGGKYKITSEALISTLRNLYIQTKNSFVKSIIETVGKSRIHSNKQMVIITEELANFDNIELI